LFLRDKDSPDDAALPRGVALSREGRRAPGFATGGAWKETYYLAVASGKGGTGKSFLATNLGVSLCSRGHRVTLVDCDFGMANDHLLMGVNPTRSIQHFFAGAQDLTEVVTQTPYGPDLVPGGSGISRLGDLSEGELLQFARGLSSISDDVDVMLLDAAAGISPQSILTLLSAQHVLVVTNPEIAALTDAYALIKCLSGYPVCPRISVIVNRVDSIGQGWATFEKLSDVARRFSHCEIHYLGAISEESGVTHQRLNQPPLVISHPTCQAARAIQGIRDRLDLLISSSETGDRASEWTIEQRFKEILGHHHLRH